MAYVYGTVGDDNIAGYDWSDDYLFGGPEYNIYGSGGAGRDTLSGYSGNDNLYGGINADKLYGGAGNDYLSGGYDNDTYYFSGSFGQDAVYRLLRRQHDRLLGSGAESGHFHLRRRRSIH